MNNFYDSLVSCNETFKRSSLNSPSVCIEKGIDSNYAAVGIITAKMCSLTKCKNIFIIVYHVSFLSGHPKKRVRDKHKKYGRIKEGRRKKGERGSRTTFSFCPWAFYLAGLASRSRRCLLAVYASASIKLSSRKAWMQIV